MRSECPRRMILKGAGTPELVGWFLHFGAVVRIVRPDSARQMALAEARKSRARCDPGLTAMA